MPIESRTLFDDGTGNSLRPTFYQIGNESFDRKLLRKLGFCRPSRTLDRRLRLVGGGSVSPEICALWLTPNRYLPPSQMASLLDRLPGLRWVYSQVTGTDHLKLEDFARRGVMLSNTGALSSRRVAEMVVACILSHAKRLPEHNAMQSRRHWRSLPCRDMQQQTVCVLGTGNIGHETGQLCRALGVHVIGVSRDPGRFESTPHPYHKVVSLNENLEETFAQCDQIVICLPATDSTRGLIGANVLNGMKADASIINVSRGEVVNEQDLCDSLSDGRIGAAYIDRPVHLPPSKWSRLYRTPNVHLTHNSSANSPNVLKDAFEQFTAGVTAIMNDNEPANRVV